MISLAGGIPAPDLFDVAGLEAALDEEVRAHRRDTFQYGLTEGEPGLREQISRLAARRAIRANAQNILAQQPIALPYMTELYLGFAMSL